MYICLCYQVPYFGISVLLNLFVLVFRGFVAAMANMASAMALPLSFSASSATFTPRLPHVTPPDQASPDLASGSYASVSGRPCRVATMSRKTLAKGFSRGFSMGGRSRGVAKRYRGARIQASLDAELEDAARQTVGVPSHFRWYVQFSRMRVRRCIQLNFVYLFGSVKFRKVLFRISLKEMDCIFEVISWYCECGVQHDIQLLR